MEQGDQFALARGALLVIGVVQMGFHGIASEAGGDRDA
jgi:hypothetical protein